MTSRGHTVGIAEILVVIGILLLGYCVYEKVQADLLVSGTKQAAKLCLTQQKDITVDVRGYETRCTFHRGEYENVAYAQNEKCKTQAKDRNISRIAGEIAGESSKQFVKGIWNGLKRKSKHEEPSDE